MSFLKGGKKGKQHPGELVRGTKELILSLDKRNPKASEKALEEITKNLGQMKLILFGDSERESEPELISSLCQEIYINHILSLVIEHMPLLEFEARKDAAQIFNNVLRKEHGGHYPCVDYIQEHPDILEHLVRGYENPELALTAGLILRECLGHEPLARLVLNSPNFVKFFTFVEVSNFDIASDAFVTLKELLTKHKALSADFLERNYDDVFSRYTLLVASSNYVTKRQSLKLLGELLLDRTNFNIMTRYISDVANLKTMMLLLRDKGKNIQFEAFHVFKVFVANPNKPPGILDILLKNKDRLVSFLSNFQNDKEDDQFKDEKQFLIKQIQQLAPN